MLPWVGGVNTSIDASLIGKNQLTVAKNVIFDTRGSRRQRPAINYDFDDASSSTSSLLGISDYWFGSSNGTKTQYVVGVSENFSVYQYIPTTGARTTLSLSSTSTQWTAAISSVSFETFNNKLIWAADGTDNKVMVWSGSGSYSNLSNAPEGSIVRQHLGRLWMNDKNNKDRLHYSETFDETVWNGLGDSGAIDIGIGDGDPDGITAIFPSFKGDLFVAKRTKLYRIKGYTPGFFEVELVSSGIGCVSHNSIALIDQDDMFFVSERGVHSMRATASFGDFEAKYLSADIQKTFNDNFVKSRLKLCQAAYIPNINSYVLAVTDSDFSSTINKALWAYNIELNAWYLFAPNIDCESLAPVVNSNKKIFYVGSSTNRLGQGLVDSENDTSESGVSSAILFNVATGFIFPSDNPYVVCGFKKVGLVFNPTSGYNLTIRFQIDNQEEQIFTLTGGSSEVLGTSFILGSSILQPTSVMEPAILSVDGYGRSFKLTIEQSATDKNIELQGFVVEYEQQGPAQTSGILT